MCIRKTISRWSCDHPILPREIYGQSQAEVWERCAAWQAGTCDEVQERTMPIPWPCTDCHQQALTAIRTTYSAFQNACVNFRDAIHPNAYLDLQFGFSVPGDATTSTLLEMQDGRLKEMRESQENLLTLLKHQRRMIITAFFIVHLPVAAPPAVVQAADVADNVGEEQPNVVEEEDNIVDDDAWRNEG